MQNLTKCFIFSVSKASFADEDVAIVADSQEAAEIELRVLGILFCGGIAFKFKEELGHV